MKNFTKSNWIKAVAMILICAFVSFDITWATGGDFRGMHLRRQQGHEVKEEEPSWDILIGPKQAKQSSRRKIAISISRLWESFKSHPALLLFFNIGANDQVARWPVDKKKKNRKYFLILLSAFGLAGVLLKGVQAKPRFVSKEQQGSRKILLKKEKQKLILELRKIKKRLSAIKKIEEGLNEKPMNKEIGYVLGQNLAYLHRPGEEWEEVKIEVAGVNSDGELTALLVDRTTAMKRFSWNLTRLPGRQDIYEVVEISTEYNRTSSRPFDMAIRIKNDKVKIIMDYRDLDKKLKDSKRFLSPKYNVATQERKYSFYSEVRRELERLSKLSLLNIDTEHTNWGKVVTISLIDGGMYKEWRYDVSKDLFVREISMDDLGNVGILIRKGGADDIVRGELIVGSGDSLQIRDIFGERYTVDDVIDNLTPNQTPRIKPLPEGAALLPAHQLKEAGRPIASQKVSHPQPILQELAHAI